SVRTAWRARWSSPTHPPISIPRPRARSCSRGKAPPAEGNRVMSGTLERLSRDVRFAARTLRREPALVTGVVATFALAIGTNAAMFGLVTQLMLAAPPGIGDPDAVARVQLAVVEEDGASFALTTTSFPTFRALASSKAAFAGVAATRPETLTTGRAPDVVQLG